MTETSWWRDDDQSMTVTALAPLTRLCIVVRACHVSPQVLLDAAAFVPTQTLDLGTYKYVAAALNS